MSILIRDEDVVDEADASDVRLRAPEDKPLGIRQALGALVPRRLVSLFLPLSVPIVLIGMCHACAAFLPPARLWGYIIQAVLLSSAPFVMALYVPIGLWFWRRKRQRGMGGILVALGIAGLGIPQDPLGKKPEGALRVISANVNAYHADEHPLPPLASLDADVWVVIERRDVQVEGMRLVADNYDRKLDRPSLGMGLWCRGAMRCEGEVIAYPGSARCRFPMAFLRVRDAVCVMGVHAPPPLLCLADQPGYISMLLEGIEAGRLISDRGVCRRGDPVLIVGDFNAVPFSEPWRRMRAAGLRDHMAGRGIHGRTWPAGGGWPNFPFFRLDQHFAGPLEVFGTHLIRLPASDHLGVVGDYRDLAPPAVVVPDVLLEHESS